MLNMADILSKRAKTIRWNINIFWWRTTPGHRNKWSPFHKRFWSKSCEHAFTKYFLKTNRWIYRWNFTSRKEKIVIEKAPSVVWNKLIFNDKYIISQEEYGASGSKDDVLKKYGFDTDSLEKRVENLIK